MKAPNLFRPHPRGFALIVTLSLMILLTVIAVGLLTLSSISLRTSGRNDAMRIAQANARTALMLAIGELQKAAGDDRRITMAADQLSTGGDSSTTPAGRKYWTGVYRAWNPDTSSNANQWASRPNAEGQFVNWLVSPPGLNSVAAATTASGSGDKAQLVGPGSAGPKTDQWVEVDSMPLKEGTATRGHMAWWVGDQGLKASISKEKTAPTALAGDARQSMQSAPTVDPRPMTCDAEKPYATADLFNPVLSSLTSVRQTELLLNDAGRKVAKNLFHDLAVGTSGMLTNVRRGGFRKDLSMYLETTAAAQRNTLAQDVLYSVPSQNGVSREPGINMEELAAYYTLHTQLKAGSGKFTTDGASVPATAQSLVFGASPVACRDDYYHHFKQPVPIAFDTFLSLEAEPATTGGGFNIRLVVDPVVIMWNPLDVPVTIPAASVPSIKYWYAPFTVKVETSGAAGTAIKNCYLHNSLSGGDHNYMSLDLTVRGTPLVFRPGEVMMISQVSKLRSDTSGIENHAIPGGPGFSFQNGYGTPLNTGESSSTRVQLKAAAGEVLKVSLVPNPYVNAKRGGPGLFPNLTGHSRWYSLMHNEMYLGRDRNPPGSSTISSLPMGGAFIDWDLSKVRVTRNETLRTPDSPTNKPDNQRLYANSLPNPGLNTFGSPVQISVSDIASVKKPFGFISFRAKTESGINNSSRNTSWLPRFNPKVFLQDFYKFNDQERDANPFEIYVMRLTDLRDYGLLEQNQGRAFFGAAWSLGDGGQTSIITHSVPREPIISLAAFQHSTANGFLFQNPKETPGDGFGPLNSREPLNPQISHAIGNSIAPSIMQPAQTYSIMGDGSGRPYADHSYLANRALWDDYFLSSIAPLPAATTTLAGSSQKKLAENFLNGNGTVHLPNRRYLPDTGNMTTSDVLSKLFSGNNPTTVAKDLVASFLRVDGMFNVNSTSVEAWKAVLSGLRETTISTANAQGGPAVKQAGASATPITSLLNPQDKVVGDSIFQDPAPWVGRRELTDDQIDSLAKAIVREIRASGPFLSLADFVNRRPGSDKKLAVAGVIERALRGNSDKVNQAFRSGTAVVPTSVSNRFLFPEAEAGLKSYGTPGIVKQADILTPIAPFISVRSDSFIVRAYGDALDKAGNIIGRAWCEAVVERGRNFIDVADKPETLLTALTSNVNKTFGRRFAIKSFRWLQSNEV